MWALILSPLGRKIALYAGIAVALFFAYRWWSNSLIERGRSEGRLEQLKADEKILKENQKKIQDIIDKDKAINEQLVANEIALKNELRRVRIDMTTNLDRAIAEIRAGREVSDARVDTIPDAELVDAIRTQLTRLRTGTDDTVPKPTGTP